MEEESDRERVGGRDRGREEEKEREKEWEGGKKIKNK